MIAGEFERQVRDALVHLYELPYLQTHPLTRYVNHDAGGHAPALGKALQRCLLETWESGEAALFMRLGYGLYRF
jgi:hypothetical protein